MPIPVGRLTKTCAPGSGAQCAQLNRVVRQRANPVTTSIVTITIDSRQRFGSRYVLSSQLGSSFTGIGNENVDRRPLWDFNLAQTGRSSGFSARFQGIHPEFNAASGFISRTGIARVVIQPRRTWFPTNSVFQSISFTPISDNTWEWDRFVDGTEPNDIKMNTSKRLLEAGIEPSVGSRGDSYDNAMAESVIGLFKTEVIHRHGPWRGFEDVEFAALEGCGGSTISGSLSRWAMFPPPSLRRSITTR